MRKWVVIILLALSGTIAMRAEMPADKDKNGNKAPSTAKKDESTAATKPAEAKKEEKPSTPDISSAETQLKQLREMLLEQARQLESQQAKMQEQQRKMEELELQLRAVREGRPAAEVTTPPTGTMAAITPTSATASPAKAQQYPSEGEKPKSPLSFKIGIADFTPGGFLDFTTIFRTTNVGSGIGTSFGSIPFNSDGPKGALTETRFTAQNSRLSLKVNAKPGSFDVTGYVEADFLGFQPTNGFVTSNSNSFRMRLYWAQVRRDKWEILAGQAWTFLTPNRVGLSPLPADIFYSQDMDTNYQVGLTWARQSAFRVIYHPTDHWALGVSFENPEQFVPGSVVFPAGGYGAQFDAGTNPATPNLHPDIIVKTAYDGKVNGRAMHVEAAGLLRSFKAVNTIATAASGSTVTDTITGGGGSVNANLEIFKNFHLIANTYYSYAGGRYIFGLGPDVIVRPDGNLSGVHSGSGIGGFEWQVTPHSMLYGYYGGAYFQKNFGILPSTTATNSCNGIASSTCVGFGFPGPNPLPPGSANRTVQEGTLGVIQTLWRNPNYGALQIITQASYLTRTPWYAANAGLPRNAHVVMGYADVRYVLP